MGILEGTLILVFTFFFSLAGIVGIGMQDASYDQGPTQIECEMYDIDGCYESLTEGEVETIVYYSIKPSE